MHVAITVNIIRMPLVSVGDGGLWTVRVDTGISKRT